MLRVVEKHRHQGASAFGWRSRDAADQGRKQPKKIVGHLPPQDAGAGLYRRKRGDEAAKRRLRGFAVTIPDAGAPFAPLPVRLRLWTTSRKKTLLSPMLGCLVEQQGRVKLHYEPRAQTVGVFILNTRCKGRPRNSEAQPKRATAPAVMSSHRLLVCLAILGWSERDLARRTDRHQTTVVRWVKGLSPVPGERPLAGNVDHLLHRPPRATLYNGRGSRKAYKSKQQAYPAIRPATAVVVSI